MLENSVLRWLERLYTPLVQLGGNLQSLFLFYMRITWGHQFFIHGLNKLNQVEQTLHFFASQNLPQPLFLTYLVGTIELVGGFCLFIGFASRLAAIPLVGVMLAALSTVHAPNISNFRFLFQPLSLVREAPYPFLLTALLIFVFGPGRLSVDAWLKRWLQSQTRY